jgi:hypothetical protein
MSKPLVLVTTFVFLALLFLYCSAEERAGQPPSISITRNGVHHTCLSTALVLRMEIPKESDYSWSETPSGTQLVVGPVTCTYDRNADLVAIETSYRSQSDIPVLLETKGDVLYRATEALKDTMFRDIGEPVEVVPNRPWDSLDRVATVVFKTKAYGYDAFPAENSVVNVDRITGNVVSVQVGSHAMCDPPNVRVSQQRALNTANRIRTLKRRQGSPETSIRLAYVSRRINDEPVLRHARLCWVVNFHAKYFTAMHGGIAIDAETGEIIDEYL